MEKRNSNNELVEKILQAGVEKMFVQYKQGKKLELVKGEILKLVEYFSLQHDKMYDALAKKKESVDKTLNATNQMCEDLREKLCKIKNTHIPAPNTGIGNRFRFLFTGKLK